MKIPPIIIILGPPSSGKGTQSQLISEKFNFYYFETSRIIVSKLEGARKNDFVLVNGKKYFFLEEKRMREKGELMSPPLITFWVKEKIKELAKEKKSIVFSGSPRTLYEGEKIIPFLKKLYGKNKILVLILKLSEKETIFRGTKRRTCTLMRHPILHSKETIKLKRCPIDGSKLEVRKDDTPETIKIRIEEYQERTLPLINYFKKGKIKIKKINGGQSVEKVFNDILNALK